MSEFAFIPEKPPYPRWLGPYTPSRGSYSGFRVRNGRVGVWAGSDDGYEFWPIVESEGTRALSRLVSQQWGGGRILMLPSGVVIKPLQEEDERAKRVVIGRFGGAIVLDRNRPRRFDLSNPGPIKAGEVWPGPKSIGLECVMKPDGSLTCSWFHPADWGQDEERALLFGGNPNLAAAFRTARPTDTGGRVRITEHGHVITNRQLHDGTWTTLYVGRVAPSDFPQPHQWMESRHT